MSYKISVIVPIYQVEEYIKDSITSIANQSFKDFEVILVNDGSIDHSVEIASEVLEKNCLDYKVIDQKNMGLSAARNSGIRNSSGEWIVCIDSDDVIHRDFLKKLYYGCINNNVDVGIANFRMVSKGDLWKFSDETSDNIIINQNDIMDRFLVRDIRIIAPGMLISKKLLVSNELYYDEKIRFSEDQHFIWRLLFIINKIVYIETPIYNYLQRESSIMSSSSIEKVLTGYYAMSNLSEDVINLDCYLLGRFILPRWIFGVLRASSKMMSRKDFKELAYKLNYKKYIKELVEFPEKKTSLLSILLLVNLNWFYMLNRKV